MKVQQLSVFLENRAGRLADAAHLLGDAGINIRALSLADTADFGVLRIIVNEPSRAMELLKEAGWTVKLTDVIAIEIPDRPAGLAGVLNTLRDAAINVEYLYAFVEKSGDKAVVVFRFEEMETARRALDESGVSVLTAEQVASI